MAYQVLARKWRPRSFKEMAGQGHVLKTLINSLDNNRLHHAYLFTGTRGVGKTTIARILARCLNCEQGVSSEPCGQCSTCTEIDEGRFIDLIEVDAASRTKVEDTRELLDNVQYAPARGRYKVYLIDEVHMLSNHSFNALLKTLEEPPPHVKFLLATTDPQKLPITVLSRCLQFSLKNLSPEILVDHMSYILGEEQIKFEDAALWQIGRAARGSVRDALTLLDQAIGFCAGNISNEEVSSFLGSIDQSIIHQLLDALNGQDAKAVLEIIAGASEYSPDFAAILEEMLSYLHRVAIAQVLPDGIDNSQGDKKQVIMHAEATLAENIQLYYQIALKGREELPLAVDSRSGLEMCLLRMLAFTPQGTAQVPSTPQTSSEEGEKKKPVVKETAVKQTAVKQTAVKQTKDSIPATTVTVRPKAEVFASLNDALQESSNKTLDLDTNSSLAKEPENKPPIIKPVVKAEPVSSSLQRVNPDLDIVVELASLTPELWIPVFFSLSLNGITQNIASNCVLGSVTGNKVQLLMAANQSAVYNEEHKRRIEQALTEYFKTAVILSVDVGTGNAGTTTNNNSETPADYRKRKELERMATAIECFEKDANVQEILERFGGIIDLGSIEPLTPKQV